MIKELRFSKTFLKGHPKYGQDTFFVEKIWSNNDPFDPPYIKPYSTKLLPKEYENYLKNDFFPMGQTIRKSTSWREGDLFDATTWAERPYTTPPAIIAKDIKILKIYLFKVLEDGLMYINNNLIYPHTIGILAQNTGLSSEDFVAWYTSPFEGQILVWKESINY